MEYESELQQRIRDDERQIHRERVETLTDQYVWRMNTAELQRAARLWVYTCFDRMPEDVLDDLADVVDPADGP